MGGGYNFSRIDNFKQGGQFGQNKSGHWIQSKNAILVKIVNRTSNNYLEKVIGSFSNLELNRFYRDSSNCTAM